MFGFRLRIGVNYWFIWGGCGGELEFDGGFLVECGFEAGGLGCLGGLGLVWLGEVALLDVPVPLGGCDIVVNHDLAVLVFAKVVEDIVRVGRVLKDDMCVCGHERLGVERSGFLGEGEVDAFDGFDNVCVEENESHMFLCVSLANAWDDEGKGTLLDIGDSASAVNVEGRCFFASVVVDRRTPREGRFAGDVGKQFRQVALDNLPEPLGVCLVVLDLEGFAIVDLVADGVCLFMVEPVEEVDVDGSESAGDISLVACELDVVNVADVEFAEDGEDILAGDREVDARDTEGWVKGVGVDLDLDVVFAFDGGGNGRGEVEGRGGRSGRGMGGTRLGGGIRGLRGCLGFGVGSGGGHFVIVSLGFLERGCFWVLCELAFQFFVRKLC